MRKPLFIIGTLLLAILLILGACAPAPTPTPKPAPTPTPTPSLPRIGEKIDIGKGAFITVESFQKRAGLGFITMLLDNSIGSDDIVVSSLMSFEVKDTEGNKAEIDIFADRDHPAPDGTVLLGDKLRGTLVYDIAPLGEEVTLYFLPDLLSRPIRIKLEVTGVTTPTPTPAPAPSAIEVTAQELWSDYKANQVAADAKYMGQTLKVTGMVIEIGKDIFDTPYITLLGGTTYIESMMGIQCMFDRKYEPELAQLTKGETITIQGEVSGYVVDVLIKDSIIVR